MSFDWRVGESGQGIWRELDPVRSGVHFLFGHAELAGTYVFERIELDLLEADDLAIDSYVAVRVLGLRFEGAEDGYLGVIDRVCVVIAIDTLDIGFALFVIEVLDVELLGFVEVDGFLVQGGEGCGEGDIGNDFRFIGDVDDDEVVA